MCQSLIQPANGVPQCSAAGADPSKISVVTEAVATGYWHYRSTWPFQINGEPVLLLCSKKWKKCHFNVNVFLFSAWPSCPFRHTKRILGTIVPNYCGELLNMTPWTWSCIAHFSCSPFFVVINRASWHFRRLFYLHMSCSKVSNLSFVFKAEEFSWLPGSVRQLTHGPRSTASVWITVTCLMIHATGSVHTNPCSTE